jgi:N utilization substance protein B
LQALYRLQLNDGPWQDSVVNDFRAGEDMATRRGSVFHRLGARDRHPSRGTRRTTGGVRRFASPVELDPVERAVLLIGLQELLQHPEVPWRVVLNESVFLTKRFGATDAHKFVNAVLDRAARELRPHEH